MKNKPTILKKVQQQVCSSLNLKDAAQMNIIRHELYGVLNKRTGIVARLYNASQTKFNRVQQNYIKDHWLDAACVGDTGNVVNIENILSYQIWKAKGRGHRQMCLVDKYGFPKSKSRSIKRYIYNGVSFQTGDMVVLSQPKGKYKGLHRGIVCIRANGQFDITTSKHKITSNVRNFMQCIRFNGYHIISEKILS